MNDSPALTNAHTGRVNGARTKIPRDRLELFTRLESNEGAKGYGTGSYFERLGRFDDGGDGAAIKAFQLHNLALVPIVNIVLSPTVLVTTRGRRRFDG
jgi:hypothetical protein